MPDRDALERTLDRAGVRARTIVAGRVPLAELPRHIEAADIVAHLRYPTARETSAALLRVLAQGRPTVMSDLENLAEIPDDAVVRADPADEEGDLPRAILRLADRPAPRARLGRAARARSWPPSTRARAAGRRTRRPSHAPPPARSRARRPAGALAARGRAMNGALALLLIASPAAYAGWGGWRLSRRADDPALPERYLGHRLRVAQIAAVSAAVLLVLLRPHWVWAVPVMFVAVHAAGFPSRRALLGETWGLRGYLSHVSAARRPPSASGCCSPSLPRSSPTSAPCAGPWR